MESGAVATPGFPGRKTKIVATTGPASWSEEAIGQLSAAGMDIARINLSHGHLGEYRALVTRVRRVAVQMGQRLAIMADVPGPKIRIGHRFEWLDLECYE